MSKQGTSARRWRSSDPDVASASARRAAGSRITAICIVLAIGGHAYSQGTPPKPQEKRFDDHVKLDLTVLVERLASPDPMIRANAALAIHLHATMARFGVNVRPTADPDQERGATETFREEDSAKGSRSPDEVWRRDLLREHPEYAQAVPVLRRLVASDRDESVRINAAAALGAIAPRDTTSLAVLATALADESAGVRHAAVAAFAIYKSNAGSVVPRIRACLQTHDSWDVRAHSAVALALIGEAEGLRATEAFIGELPDALPDARGAVARALDRLEVAWMKDVVPEMVRELAPELRELGAALAPREVDVFLRRAKGNALSIDYAGGHFETVAGLVKALKRSRDVRSRAPADVVIRLFVEKGVPAESELEVFRALDGAGFTHVEHVGGRPRDRPVRVENKHYVELLAAREHLAVFELGSPESTELVLRKPAATNPHHPLARAHCVLACPPESSWRDLCHGLRLLSEDGFQSVLVELTAEEGSPGRLPVRTRPVGRPRAGANRQNEFVIEFRGHGSEAAPTVDGHRIEKQEMLARLAASRVLADRRHKGLRFVCVGQPGVRLRVLFDWMAGPFAFAREPLRIGLLPEEQPAPR